MEDKLFKFILWCCKNHYKPDLHSFFIDTTIGRAFVECRSHEVYIELNDVEGKKSKWVGTPVAAANYLDGLSANFDTVDM